MKNSILLTVLAIVAVSQLTLAQSHLYKKVPIDPDGPYKRVYNPENIPKENDIKGFPSEFTMSFKNAQHNVAYETSTDAPKWLNDGVSWKFKEARAWPLDDDNVFGSEVGGASRGLATMTQYYGNALNVAAVDGVIYAESDDMFAYALNAKTGKLIWRTSPVGNNLMGTPLIKNDKVYLNAGGVSFTFGQTVKYANNPDKSERGAGVSYNGIIALDKKTGEFQWFFATTGETMTTPAYHDGIIYLATGGGEVYAINATTGEKIWMKHTGGMANMANPVYHDGKLYVSMAVSDYVFCMDAKDGNILWKGQMPGATNTSMGDVTPAIDEGILVMNSVINPLPQDDGSTTMNTRVRAFDANSGKVLWDQELGRGPKPQSFKGGVSMIHNGTVYIGNPTTSKYFAFDLKTGNKKWEWKVPHDSPAGSGRGPGTMYKGTLYISTGAYVYALNPDSGQLINSVKVGGNFPILSPTIVGGTMYLGNNYDWIIALPVKEVNPNFKMD